MTMITYNEQSSQLIAPEAAWGQTNSQRKEMLASAASDVVQLDQVAGPGWRAY
jgi:hypothetical protein